MYTGDGICIPSKCKEGYVWIRTGCFESKYCLGKQLNGVCVYDKKDNWYMTHMSEKKKQHFKLWMI